MTKEYTSDKYITDTPSVAVTFKRSSITYTLDGSVKLANSL